MRLPDHLHAAVNLGPLFTLGFVLAQPDPDKNLICRIDGPDSLENSGETEKIGRLAVTEMPTESILILPMMEVQPVPRL